MHQIDLLTNGVLILGAGLTIGWMFRAIGISPIVGYILAGVTIGPSGLGLIAQADVGPLAEFGLVLLLFIIGLELSPELLVNLGRRLLVVSFTQMAIATSLGWLGAWFFLDAGTQTGFLLGVVFALSSTAIVLKQLSDRGEADTVAGRLTTGILLVQDILVIVIMLCLPLAAMDGGAGWREQVLPSALGLLGLAVILLFGRRLLSAILENAVLPGGPEFISLFAVLAAFGGAWLASLVGWSLPLGACIAGLVLAEADARHQIASDILPFRDVFNTLFFISLGMLIDVNLVIEYALPLTLVIAATLILKSGITAFAVGIAGWPLSTSLQIGIGMCTVSEFGYVLAWEAARLGLMPEAMLALVTTYALGTMVLGAMLVPVARPLALGIARVLQPDREPFDTEAPEPEGDIAHIIVCGFGTTGQNLARVLKATRIPFTVIELDPRLARIARESDVPVLMGDASRYTILKHAGLDRAHGIVVTINDVDATARIVGRVRAARPDLYILADTRTADEIDKLYQLGADQVLAQDFETSIELIARILREIDVPENIVGGQLAALRAGRYGVLRGRAADVQASEELMRVLQLTATRTHYLEKDSPVCGKSIGELDLRARTGVTIIAVVRNGQPTTSPSTDFRLEAGDVLVLVGSHSQLEAATSALVSQSAGHIQPLPESE